MFNISFHIKNLNVLSSLILTIRARATCGFYMKRIILFYILYIIHFYRYFGRLSSISNGLLEVSITSVSIFDLVR